MALIQVCDVCREPGKDLLLYVVDDGKSPATELALCEDDATPLVTLLALARGEMQPALRKSPAKRTIRAGTSGRIATVAEIEASKR